MRPFLRHLPAFPLVFVMSAGSASAQIAIPDPASTARVRLGPLFLSPTLALTNIGTDDNVFNEPDQQSPKRDFTMTVTPATDLWLRMGRTWLTGTIKEDLVYYRTFASQRSANSSYKGGWLVPLNRLTLDGNVLYTSTNARPGLEIDARTHRIERGFDGSVDLRVLSKTFVGVRAQRTTTRFDEGAFFLGTDLRSQLNGTDTTVGLTAHHQLTPLTSLTLDVSREQDRFDNAAALRDSDSDAVRVGLSFDPFALIKGRFSVGYRNFKPRGAELPGFKGTTLAADLSYVALGSTKLSVQATRDITYSFDANQPYYLLTGVTVSLDQRIYGPVDVGATVGVQQLAYRNRVNAVVPVPDRVDHVRTYGGTVGYRMSRDFRIGLNVEKSRRTSKLADRRFNGLRVGASVTYGF